MYVTFNSIYNTKKYSRRERWALGELTLLTDGHNIIIIIENGREPAEVIRIYEKKICQSDEREGHKLKINWIQIFE